ncbi:baseplate J/gp47 family protein [Salmonella enterica subsp. enterica serovar Ealing]|uniref:Baseplate J/gp47 family protein n=1 Tax=Salmonella enterica I TaxID=59201 RepID=A0A403QH36_SALET|nr:baseplate J/gp47 family protein [Salmonella enterica]EBX2201977.1 baseplate protein [Salmonella enterica subsp. enterica serovar Oranienburg]EDT7530635.1 baseplate J/gp47 family protein [Salmonella enterica subsp. enterica serovar Adelaide]EDX6360914.1 baseplate J/gp47 family protein [Salmonella enterica subsp. enterica serovar Ealing]MIY13128.1 baseplate J/gp47 family protein [Salmonella enterica subsp. enterica serovar Jangwani]MML54043.1 baseplate J/gp47 family protein [Salmonella enteri
MALVLADPVFVETDPEKITRELVEKYQADSGKTLYPAQDEMLLINLIAYRESLVRTAIQDASEQNLVAFSRAPMLDYLGELVGVYRLDAQAATTTLQFSLEFPAVQPVLIPAGTRVSASDSVVFTTDEDTTLPAGSAQVSIHATCTLPGLAGNDWQPAQISNLMDDIGDGSLDFTVTNPSVSTGGTDPESDDHLRERILLAPESFSNAGSRGAYRFHAMSAHQDIVDVAVVRPEPGTVELYPLMSYGLPDQNLLDLVTGICSDEKVRPLTDTVQVKPPVKVDYSISASIRVYDDQDMELVMKRADSAIRGWVARQSSRLGMDIIPSQISAALSVPGVYRVTLTLPEERVLADNEWAHCTGINLIPEGKSHG